MYIFECLHHKIILKVNSWNIQLAIASCHSEINCISLVSP